MVIDNEFRFDKCRIQTESAMYLVNDVSGVAGNDFIDFVGGFL